MEPTSEQPREISPAERIDNAKSTIANMPPELQQKVAGFIESMSKTIFAQQTSVSGDTVSVKATPEQLAFYDRRFQEIATTGVLNPRDINSNKKITFSE